MFGLFNKKPKYWALDDSYNGGKEASFIGSTEGCIKTVKISRDEFTGSAIVLMSFDELEVQPDEVAISITLSKREIGRNKISQNNSGNFIVLRIDSKDSAKLADSRGITFSFIKESTVIASDWVPTKGHRIDICKAVTYL